MSGRTAEFVKPSFLEHARAYIAIAAQGAIVVTADGEEKIMEASGGIMGRGSQEFYKGGSKATGVKMVFDSGETYKRAKEALVAEKCIEVPRSSLAF